MFFNWNLALRTYFIEYQFFTPSVKRFSRFMTSGNGNLKMQIKIPQSSLSANFIFFSTTPCIKICALIRHTFCARLVKLCVTKHKCRLFFCSFFQTQGNVFNQPKQKVLSHVGINQDNLYLTFSKSGRFKSKETDFHMSNLIINK